MICINKTKYNIKIPFEIKNSESIKKWVLMVELGFFFPLICAITVVIFLFFIFTFSNENYREFYINGFMLGLSNKSHID